MIIVTLPNSKLVLGGTEEERMLHDKALCQHYGKPVQWVDAEDGARFHVTFAEAMASMHAEHSAITAKMYQGADSMWGVL